MGAEWPAGASLAMESWPARSRGLMSSILQGSWAIGFLASSAIYGLLYDYIGWRGLLWIGVLPALVVVWVRKYVKEPEIWLENRKKQRETRREVRLPLVAIFKRGLLANTLTACWWMASGFVVYYSIFSLFATHLQKDLGLSPGLVVVPLMISNLVSFAISYRFQRMPIYEALAHQLGIHLPSITTRQDVAHFRVSVAMRPPDTVSGLPWGTDHDFPHVHADPGLDVALHRMGASRSESIARRQQKRCNESGGCRDAGRHPSCVWLGSRTRRVGAVFKCQRPTLDVEI